MRFLEELYKNLVIDVTKDFTYQDYFHKREIAISQLMDKFSIERSDENYNEICEFVKIIKDEIDCQHEYVQNQIILYIFDKLLRKICED